MTTHNDKNLKYESSKVEKNIFSENIFDNWDIDEKYFDQMSKKACGKNGKIKGFVELFPEDVKKIYQMCLED